MGYRAEKEKVAAKGAIVKRVLLCIFSCLLVGLLIFSCFVPPESWKYYFVLPKITERKFGELRIHFIDVGQGDSTLIELPDGKVMLIDGGNDTDGTKKRVLRYLNALDIDVIDYLLVTHTDSDHCGALDEVVRFKKVLNAYLPFTFEETDVQYAELYDMILKKGCAVWEGSREIDLSSKNGETPYTLTFLYPYATASGGSIEGDNEKSSVIWLDYFGTSALLGGDAPKAVESVLMRDDKAELLSSRGVRLNSTEIFKLSHHGSMDSNGKAFLQYLGVKTAVASCGKNNQYRHPSATVLTYLAELRAEVYRTDLQGHVLLTVEKGGKYSVQTVNSD